MGTRPRYAELSDELVCQIRDGTYPVGSLLPTEMEIAEARGLSRNTVRSAIARLVALGLVTRQKGVGTRVAMASPGGYDASTTSLEQLAHFGAATKRSVRGVTRVVADDVLAARLKCRAGQTWLCVSVIRSQPGQEATPICWTENFIDPAYEQIIEQIDGHPGLIADLIGKTFGVVVDEVQQIIRPAILSATIAEALSATTGEPALEIIRRYVSAGKVVYVSASTHPGDRFEYSMSLRRQTSWGPPSSGE